ncbi:hypothetical protein RNO17_15895, partial [Escherichia coli]|nr:hypothetical protein [Escherichia coli]
RGCNPTSSKFIHTWLRFGEIMRGSLRTQLAHVDKNSIRGTYNHAQYLDGRREMLQWYADYMDSLEHGGNVVHMVFEKHA